MPEELLVSLMLSSVPEGIHGMIEDESVRVEYGSPSNIHCTLESPEPVDYSLNASELPCEVQKGEWKRVGDTYVSRFEITTPSVKEEPGEYRLRVNALSPTTGAEAFGLEPYMGIPLRVDKGTIKAINCVVEDDKGSTNCFLRGGTYTIRAEFQYPGPGKVKANLRPVLLTNGKRVPLSTRVRELNLKEGKTTPARWEVRTPEADGRYTLAFEDTAGVDIPCGEVWVSHLRTVALHEVSVSGEGSVRVAGLAPHRVSVALVSFNGEGHTIVGRTEVQGDFNVEFGPVEGECYIVVAPDLSVPEGYMDRGPDVLKKASGDLGFDIVSVNPEGSTDKKEGEEEGSVLVGAAESLYMDGDRAVVRLWSPSDVMGHLSLVNEVTGETVLSANVAGRTAEMEYVIREESGMTPYSAVLRLEDGTTKTYPRLFWTDMPHTASVRVVNASPSSLMLPGERPVARTALGQYKMTFTSYGDIIFRKKGRVMKDCTAEEIAWVIFSYTFDTSAWREAVEENLSRLRNAAGGALKKGRDGRLEALTGVIAAAIKGEGDTNDIAELLESWYRRDSTRFASGKRGNPPAIPDSAPQVDGIRGMYDLMALSLYTQYISLSLAIAAASEIAADLEDSSILSSRIRNIFNRINRSVREYSHIIEWLSRSAEEIRPVVENNGRIRATYNLLAKNLRAVPRPEKLRFGRGEIVSLDIAMERRGELTPGRGGDDIKLEIEVALPEKGWYIVYPTNLEGMSHHAFTDIDLNVDSLQFRFATPYMPEYPDSNILFYIGVRNDFESSLLSDLPVKGDAATSPSTGGKADGDTPLSDAVKKALSDALSIMIKLENSVPLSREEENIRRKATTDGSFCLEKMAGLYKCPVSDLLSAASSSAAFYVSEKEGRLGILGRKQVLHILSLADEEELAKKLSSPTTLMRYLSIASTPESRLIGMLFLTDAVTIRPSALVASRKRPFKIAPNIPEHDDLYTMLGIERGKRGSIRREDTRGQKLARQSLPKGKSFRIGGLALRDIKDLVTALYTLSPEEIHTALSREDFQAFLRDLRARELAREFDAVKISAKVFRKSPLQVKRELIVRMETVMSGSVNFIDILSPLVENLLFGEEDVSIHMKERLLEAGDRNTGMLILDHIFSAPPENRIRAIDLMKEMDFRAAIPVIYRIARTTRLPEEMNTAVRALVKLGAPDDILKDLKRASESVVGAGESGELIELTLRKRKKKPAEDN